MRSLLVRRASLAVVTVAAASVIVYWATAVLPGDAASAILGQSATPQRLAALRAQLGLNRPPLAAFWHWASGYARGDFGSSLSFREPVWDVVEPRLANSALLVLVAAVISTVVGFAGGMLAARRADGIIDTLLSVVALVSTAIPEFIVGVVIVFVFSVSFLHWFPAVSTLLPGDYIWDEPAKIVLPALTLVVVVTPYVFRMVRAATIEALRSDYTELATLKGTSPAKVLLRHALPNALPPAIQVVGLNLLYLCGGIVLVEAVFSYPGIGLTLVNAVQDRDAPLIQFLVVLLSVIYVIVNIATDAFVLMVTPRKRYPR